MPLEESIWVKTSGCKPSKASDLFSNKNRFTLLVFSKFADTLEAHGLFFQKKQLKKFQGPAAHPGYQYAHASIVSIQGVANEFKN
jgi:hypothetical protein